LEGKDLHGAPTTSADDSIAEAEAAESGRVSDNVHFSLTSPSTVRPGAVFILGAWAHTDAQRAEVLRRARLVTGPEPRLAASKGPVPLGRDTTLTVRLHIPSFGIHGAEDVLHWTGEVGNASFLVRVPGEAPLGTAPGTLSVYVEALQIARLDFLIQVGQELPGFGYLDARERRVRNGFASYASEDRDEVLARIQGMLKVLPTLDVFLDVAALRSGEDWKERLRHEIEVRDIFYLFWSQAASRSQWVEREWRLALEARGLDFIDPVPLDPPTKAPPPPELSDLHFNEWTLAYRTPRSGPVEGPPTPS
jgi:hypothetical protein